MQVLSLYELVLILRSL